MKEKKIGMALVKTRAYERSKALPEVVNLPDESQKRQSIVRTPMLNAQSYNSHSCSDMGEIGWRLRRRGDGGMRR